MTTKDLRADLIAKLVDSGFTPDEEDPELFWWHTGVRFNFSNYDGGKCLMEVRYGPEGYYGLPFGPNCPDEVILAAVAAAVEVQRKHERSLIIRFPTYEEAKKLEKGMTVDHPLHGECVITDHPHPADGRRRGIVATAKNTDTGERVKLTFPQGRHVDPTTLRKDDIVFYPGQGLVRLHEDAAPLTDGEPDDAAASVLRLRDPVQLNLTWRDGFAYLVHSHLVHPAAEQES